MKNVLTFACFGIVALAILYGVKLIAISGQNQDSEYHSIPIPPSQPAPQTKRFSLLPGQSGQLVNHIYRRIEIHSQYPIRAFNGNCVNNYTADFTCVGDPSDVTVIDIRRPPIFSTPTANLVIITASAN